MNIGRKSFCRRLAVYSVLIAVTMFLLLPLMYMFSVSVEDQSQRFGLIPSTFRIGTYIDVIRNVDISRMFLNSWVICGSVVLLSLVLSTFTAYGLSRLRFRSKKLLVAAILFTQMPPPVLLALSYFVITYRIGLYNTYTILILLNGAFALPFSIIMLKQYFDTIPYELDEAAVLDGCSRLGLFFKVILPVSRPGVAAVAMYVFLNTWKEYIYALTLTSTVSRRPITVGISMFLGQFVMKWNELMATSIWASLPVVFLFIVLQRSFVSGLTAGAVKQ